MIQKHLTKLLLAIGISVAASCAALYIWKHEHRPSLFELYVFNLKNGNSLFIRTPDDYRILVNGGANLEVIRHISTLLPFYSRHIDMVVASDTEKKHVGGLINIIERYGVDQVIVPAVTLENLDLASSTDKTFDEFLKTVRAKKIPIREVVAGEELKWGSEVKVEILFPDIPDHFAYSKASAPEIVFNVTYDSTNILITGDSSKKIQKHVAIHSSTTNPIDVLIMNNSASGDSLDRTFMETFLPENLIYSQSISRSPGINLFPYEKRFNIKEKTVRVVSDGISVNIERVK